MKLNALLRGLGAHTCPALEQALEQAVGLAVELAVKVNTREDAIAWFAHAGHALPAQGN